MKPGNHTLIALCLASLALPGLAAALYGQSDLINTAWQTPVPIQCLLSAHQQNYTLDEPLQVKVTLKNVSTELQILSWPPEASFAFEFMIYDKFRELRTKRDAMANLRPKSIREDLRQEREIRLYPGEEFSTTIDLNDWYSLKTDGRHLIQARFYDNRLHKQVWSNPLFVNLKPNQRIVRELRIIDEIRREEEEKVMTPEGTVSFLLQSMIEKDWESAYKYLQWERLILLYKPHAENWKNASTPEAREKVMAEFQSGLKKMPEYDSLVRFRIQNIVFPADPDERIVYAYLRFQSPVMPNYLNTYRLRRRGNKWYIWDIESQVSKTRDWEDFDFNRNIRNP